MLYIKQEVFAAVKFRGRLQQHKPTTPPVYSMDTGFHSRDERQAGLSLMYLRFFANRFADFSTKRFSAVTFVQCAKIKSRAKALQAGQYDTWTCSPGSTLLECSA